MGKTAVERCNVQDKLTKREMGEIIITIFYMIFISIHSHLINKINLQNLTLTIMKCSKIRVRWRVQTEPTTDTGVSNDTV